MPRVVKRKRKRLLTEVGEDTIPILIQQKVRIVTLNKFLGGPNQIFMTLLADPYTHFITYHTRPLPFIVQTNGMLIPDSHSDTERRNAHYHPS